MTGSSPGTSPPPPSPTILRIEALRVVHPGPHGGVVALDGLDLSVEAGCAVALVGESGSGKSTAAAAVLGLLPPTARRWGRVEVAGLDVAAAGTAGLRLLRGRLAGFVGQGPFAAFDPLFDVGAQLAEAFRAHGTGDGAAEVARALAEAGLAEEGGVPSGPPHRWSGGMLQRAQLAAALLHRPPLLVADEPTSALDTVRTARMAGTLAGLKARGTALLLATHDLGLASSLADEVVVLRAGRVVERGPARQVLGAPREGYTRALVDAHPSRGMAAGPDEG